jgi:hypothetical protein
MPIGRSQIPKQIEGKLRGARDEKRRVKVYSKGGMKNGRKLNKLAVQLGKSAKLHSKQAKVVKGIIRGSKKRNGKKA